MNNTLPNPEQNEPISFQELSSALVDETKFFSPKYLPRLSNLSTTEFSNLKAIWLNIALQRRRSLLEDLEELAEENSLVFFENIFQFAIQDPDAQVRQTAVRALWENDDKNLIEVFINLMHNDEEEIVRSQAAAGLGHFIYLSELGKLPASVSEHIVEELLTVLEGETHRITKMRALESLGFADNPKVVKWIEEVMESKDEDWQSSALVAMGRSADEQWESYVMDKLSHQNNLIRLEAAKAAGLLLIEHAESHLIHLCDDQDEEVRMAAAWSLSEIGGQDALAALETLFDTTDDPDELDLIQAALDNLAYNNELDDLGLFDIDDDFDDSTDFN